MPSITSKSFTTLVGDMVTAIQGSTSRLVDLTIGSILRAIVESVSSVVVWLEGLILLLLQTTRAASSSGADLDSWMADFGLTRLPAQPATGLVTFARFTTTAQGIVTVGATVQTTDGTQQYTVVADTANSAFSASLNGYVLPIGTASIDVPVSAITAGSAGNAAAGSISVISAAIQYVDTVTNAASFTTGADAELDPAFRARFQAYIANLSKATKAAIGFAETSLQQGVSYTLTENYEYDGTYRPGYFYVVVDDGTGDPPSGFLTAAANAIDATRGFTIDFGVFAPVIETADVAMTLTIDSNYDISATRASVQTALQNYINGLGLGNTLHYTRLSQVAYDASPGVTNVSAMTINSGTSDLAANNKQTVKAGTITLS